MRHTLLIMLAGPMQAWGSRSRFDDRDTHLEPTKSGVLGLVCAAMGRDRGESMEDLAALRFGVRVEAAGRVMTDYQTAQNVVRAGGGSNLATVTSQRHYLADARFLAGLEGEEITLLRQIEAALHAPQWCLSLGRKSFPLSLPPYLPGGSLREGVELEKVLTQEPWRPVHRYERPPEAQRLALEDVFGEVVLADLPLDYAERRFGLRRVRISYPKTRPPRASFLEGE